MIKFVNDLRQVGGFSWVPLVSSTNKTDSHDIAEILLKVALNTIYLNLTHIKTICYSIGEHSINSDFHSAVVYLQLFILFL